MCASRGHEELGANPPGHMGRVHECGSLQKSSVRREYHIAPHPSFGAINQVGWRAVSCPGQALLLPCSLPITEVRTSTPRSESGLSVRRTGD